MGSLSQKAFFIGDWKVSPTEGLLLRGDDVVHLEPKAMELLVYLAQRQGEVVAREDIEKDVWGGTLVSYDSITSTVIKLRKALQDNAREPDYIATIPKRGYELIASVGEQDDPGTNEGTGSIGLQNTKKFSWYLLFVGFLVVAVGVAWFVMSASVDPVVIDESNVAPISKDNVDFQTFETPSIAVLPFDNISGDPAQEYFANGITRDLITELSRISELTVISKDSTFLLKDDTLDRIRQELGVDYVLKGSVRRDAKQIRINTQLIETHSGRHLWGEHFDATLDDTFSVQDAITEQIAGVLKIHFSTGQGSTVARYFPSIEAYDLFLQGLDFYGRRSFEDLEQAKSYFQQAINLDPNFARAYANLGLIHLRHAIDGWEINTQGELDKAKSLALQALQLNDQLAEIHFVNAFVNLYQRDYESAIRGLGKALDLRPSYADGYAMLAWVLHFSARPEHAEINLKRAILLNPKTPTAYLLVQGEGEFIQGHYIDAISTLESALEKNPINPRTQIVLAASYAQANRIDDANWIIDQLLAHHPKVTITRLQNAFPFRDDKQIQQFQEGLRKAGLPE